MGKVADFLPSRFGLPYLNRWPDVPDRTFTLNYQVRDPSPLFESQAS
ncbi:MAG TPA: hypothetical protein VKT80_15015 [Chloroflexota bacterium]|nr:hypothetical protein [Chloroflexota bacterium]